MCDARNSKDVRVVVHFYTNRFCRGEGCDYNIQSVALQYYIYVLYRVSCGVRGAGIIASSRRATYNFVRLKITATAIAA
jgi:hypothetical protein